MPEHISNKTEQQTIQKAEEFLDLLQDSLIPDKDGRFKQSFNFRKIWEGSRGLQQDRIGGMPVILIPEVSQLYAKLGRDKRIWEGVFEEVIETTKQTRQKGNPSDLVRKARVGLGVAVALGMNQETDDPDLLPVKKVIDGLVDTYGTGLDCVWKTEEGNFPVTIIRILGTGWDGRTYVAVKGSNTGIPMDELGRAEEFQPAEQIREEAKYKEENVKKILSNLRDAWTEKEGESYNDWWTKRETAEELLMQLDKISGSKNLQEVIRQKEEECRNVYWNTPDPNWYLSAPEQFELFKKLFAKSSPEVARAFSESVEAYNERKKVSDSDDKNKRGEIDDRKNKSVHVFKSSLDNANPYLRSEEDDKLRDEYDEYDEYGLQRQFKKAVLDKLPVSKVLEIRRDLINCQAEIAEFELKKAKNWQKFYEDLAEKAGVEIVSDEGKVFLRAKQTESPVETEVSSKEEQLISIWQNPGRAAVEHIKIRGEGRNMGEKIIGDDFIGFVLPSNEDENAACEDRAGFIELADGTKIFLGADGVGGSYMGSLAAEKIVALAKDLLTNNSFNGLSSVFDRPNGQLGFVDYLNTNIKYYQAYILYHYFQNFQDNQSLGQLEKEAFMEQAKKGSETTFFMVAISPSGEVRYLSVGDGVIEKIAANGQIEDFLPTEHNLRPEGGFSTVDGFVGEYRSGAVHLNEGEMLLFGTDGMKYNLKVLQQAFRNGARPGRIDQVPDDLTVFAYHQASQIKSLPDWKSDRNLSVVTGDKPDTAGLTEIKASTPPDQPRQEASTAAQTEEAGPPEQRQQAENQAAAALTELARRKGITPQELLKQLRAEQGK